MEASRETQVKVDGPGGRRSKEDENTGWRVKTEDRQVWNRTVEQTKTHPEL